MAVLKHSQNNSEQGWRPEGTRVTVYGRKHYSTTGDPTYNGVNLVVLPTIRHKYFDTVIHTFLSVLHAAPRRYDAILICNAANSIFAFIPRLFGTPTLVNVDGLERKRKKWNWVGRQYYLVSEWLSTFLPTAIVTDARVIQDYYATRYRKESEMIAYGAEVARRADPEKLLRFGLQPNRYMLYVSRLEPENNAHLVIEAYSRVKTDMPLVIVGDAPYAEEYIARLKSTRDPESNSWGLSSAKTTGRCSRTPIATSTPQRSEAHTRR